MLNPRSLFMCICLAAVCFLMYSQPAAGKAPEDVGPRQIGSRLELFVDDWLIDKMDGVELELQRPVDAGKAVELNQPWEGRHSIVLSLLKDGGKYRMYYRAGTYGGGKPFALCYAESKDGIHWTKPDLGIYEFDGSKKNNITYLGDTFHCFKDENPNEPAERRYKGLRYGKDSSEAVGLGVMVSPDGLNWKWWRDAVKEPVIIGGPLDTINTALWDPRRKLYLAFLRNWVTKSKGFGVPPDLDSPPSQYHGWWVKPDFIRTITVATSKDFLSWSRQQWAIDGKSTPIDNLYTNAVAAYFRAPHIYTAFPMRFVPSRKVIPGWPKKGCSDAIFMSSRDGLHWDRRFMEAFIRPGPDQGNWTDRNLITAPGVIQTGPAEMSVYYTSHYGHDDNHLRRGTLRLDGFVSVKADYNGGEFVTKPLVFSGTDKHETVLLINYSTSAVGSVQVEIQDAAGSAIAGYALGDALEIVGDQIERVVSWKGGSDVGSLAGKPIRLRFVMKDADLYSIRFGLNNDPSLSLRLGASVPTKRSPVGELFYDGDIAEILVYDRVLPPEQVNEAGSYLETKYGLDTAYNPAGPAAEPPRSGLEIWLKADAIEGMKDGGAVREWPNSAAGKAMAKAEQTSPERRLKYHANVIDSLPVVRGRRFGAKVPQDGTFMELVATNGGGVTLAHLCDPGMTVLAVLKPARGLSNVLLQNLAETFVLDAGKDACLFSRRGRYILGGDSDSPGFRILAVTASNMLFAGQPNDVRFFVDGQAKPSRVPTVALKPLAERPGRLFYEEDFTTQRYRFTTRHTNAHHLELVPGSVWVRMRPGGASPVFIWRVEGDRPVRNILVQVKGQANTVNLVTDHHLDVSTDGKKWSHGVSASSFKHNASGWSMHYDPPLTVDLSGKAEFTAVKEFYVRLRMNAGDWKEMHPYPSGMISSIRIEADFLQKDE